MRIYVASLSDYNASVLHGAWFDLDDFTDGNDLSILLTAEQGAKIRAFAASRGLATVQAADIVISAGLEALGFNLLPAKN